MLHLIPAPLHRGGLRLAHALRLVWWRVRRPRIAGVRVLVQDGAGRVLMVRHHYGSGRWMLPGGAMKRGEDPLAAAARELAEELHCRLSDPVLAMVSEEPLRGATNVVCIVAGSTPDAPRPDGREIDEFGWFMPDALPANLSPGQRDGLPEWLRAARAAAPRVAPPG